VHVTEWSAIAKEFELGAGAATEVRLKILYYPYWRVTAESRQLMTRPAGDGALLVTIPETATTVKVNFVEPASTRVAGVLSILGVVAIGFLCAYRF
jgi:hypothetical protein